MNSSFYILLLYCFTSITLLGEDKILFSTTLQNDEKLRKIEVVSYPHTLRCIINEREYEVNSAGFQIERNGEPIWRYYRPLILGEFNSPRETDWGILVESERESIFLILAHLDSGRVILSENSDPAQAVSLVTLSDKIETVIKTTRDELNETTREMLSQFISLPEEIRLQIPRIVNISFLGKDENSN